MILYGLSTYPFEIYEIYIEKETKGTYWLSRDPRQRHVGRIIRKWTLGGRINLSPDLLVSSFIEEQNAKIDGLHVQAERYHKYISRAEKLLEDYED